MGYEEIVDKITIYKEKVIEAFHPKKIILYGSYVKGNAREESDIDIAIVFLVNCGRFFRKILTVIQNKERN